MPNTKDRGHNPFNGADLNLRLVRSGGAESRSQHHSERLSAEDRRQEQTRGAAAWMRRLTVDFGTDPLQSAKLAERIGNLPNTNCVLNPSGRCSDRRIFGRSTRAGWYQLGTGSDRKLRKIPEKTLGLW
jgi:predicted TIM-barrel fold metal-dependent hydrolase